MSSFQDLLQRLQSGEYLINGYAIPGLRLQVLGLVCHTQHLSNQNPMLESSLALFPFLVGTTMNYRGPKVLVYMIVAQTATIMTIWFLLPSQRRHHCEMLHVLTRLC